MTNPGYAILLEIIKLAVEEGKTELWVDSDFLPPDYKDKLIEDGFVVAEPEYRKGKLGILISW